MGEDDLCTTQNEQCLVNNRSYSESSTGIQSLALFIGCRTDYRCHFPRKRDRRFTKANIRPFLGRGGGKVVSVLAFYSDNPNSNPKEAKKICLKRTKIRKKEAGVGTLKKHLVVHGSYLESFNNLVIIF